MVYLESVRREGKYQVGQVINRYGKKYRIVKIEYNSSEKTWAIFGEEV
jgi:hypothetical protein